MENETRLPSKSDRRGMYLYAGIGVVAAGAVLWNTIARLIAVAPGTGIPVTVPLEQSASLPLGPGGSGVDTVVERAVITVADPAPATLFALWAAPIVSGAAWIAGIAIAVLFCLRLARGRAFERGTSRLVYTGVGVLAVGWLAGSLFTQMSANGALAAVSDRSYDSAQFGTDWVAIFGMLVLVAIAVALHIGERLRSDSEGLV